MVDAKNVDNDFRHREYAGFYDGHRVQQRTHRRRGNHGRRQPAMYRHHRGLADTEQEQHQHGVQAFLDIFQLAGKVQINIGMLEANFLPLL